MNELTNWQKFFPKIVGIIASPRPGTAAADVKEYFVNSKKHFSNGFPSRGGSRYDRSFYLGFGRHMQKITPLGPCGKSSGEEVILL